MVIRAYPQIRLQCDMNIRQYRSRTVESKIKPVQIDAVGREGLRFVTELRIPPDPQLLLAFCVSFQNKSVRPQGRIVAAQLQPDGRFAYDVRFDRLPDREAEVGWLELLLSLSAYRHIRYLQLDDVYKDMDDKLQERAALDVRA